MAKEIKSMELETIIKYLNELSFTAIDFETANEQRDSICSVGLVTVRNGNITDKKHFLVKPKDLRFTEINKRIHGICEEDVTNSPEFCEVWDHIHLSIDNQIVLAHNADFDISALKQTLNYYNISIPTFKYICTQKLAQEVFSDLQNYRLNDIAKYFGSTLIHHDSISDASIAAEIGIKAIPNYNKSLYSYGYDELTYFITKRNSMEKKENSFSDGFAVKKINSELLKPNLDGANPDNLFYNKKVVFTGDLQQITRQEAATKIQSLGADINTTISKKTEIVVIGKGAGPSKMKKIEDYNLQGCNIRLIYEQEFLSIINN